MRRAIRVGCCSLSLGALALELLGAVLLTSCKSPQEKACLEQFASAQSVVMKVEAEDLASVVGSVAAVEEALGTCKAAGRDGEAEELGKAHAQLAAHRDRMLRRAEMMAERTELTPDELAALIKSGDPNCPRGQAYVHRKSGKHITCVGPQPVDMSRARAEEYFKGRRYKTSPGASPSELRVEYGAELVVFSYADPNQPPRCVTLYPPPEQSWQEATARLTGVRPARLKPNQPIRRASGALPFALEESAEKVVARIGDCSS
jgi:hypothetical protein